MDCPWCGEDYPGPEGLAEHVLFGHPQAPLGGKVLRLQTLGGCVVQVRCWCGYWYEVSAPPRPGWRGWVGHLEGRGGLGAHLAEVLFTEEQERWRLSGDG